MTSRRPDQLPAYAQSWEDWERIQAHIVALVDEAPEFSVEQQERLRPLLAPSAPSAPLSRRRVA